MAQKEKTKKGSSTCFDIKGDCISIQVDKILFIEWEDSYGATSGWVSLDGYKPEGLICKSCGFLVYQDKKVVALAPNYAPSTTYTHEQANGLMVIPKTCIRRVTSFCL